MPAKFWSLKKILSDLFYFIFTLKSKISYIFFSKINFKNRYSKSSGKSAWQIKSLIFYRSVYTECPYSRLTAYRQLPQNIPGHTFTATNGDTVKLPETYQYNKEPSGCKDVHFIEYSSQQWFLGHKNSKLIINSRILSSGISGEPSRYVSSPVTYTIYTKAGDNARYFCKIISVCSHGNQTITESDT